MNNKKNILSRFNLSLNGLVRRNRKRILTLNSLNKNILDFSSNDYLGLSKHPKLLYSIKKAIKKGVPIGSTGSRLLCGNHIEHEILEFHAAKMFGSEKSLYFINGFIANYALFTCLPKMSDLVIFDILVHASIYEGIAACKAKTIPAKHNDVFHFEEIIKKHRKEGFIGQIWISIESIYSMDGDIAPIDDFIDIVNKYNIFLIVDEAHSTGIWGKDGKGFVSKYNNIDNVISMHTCSKALGTSGALICASKIICDYMINFSRPFIYSTAPPPLSAYIVNKALIIIQDEGVKLRLRLLKQINLFKKLFSNLNLKTSLTQIQPIIIGDAGKTMKISKELYDQGYNIKGIRPPTVANGSSRLRIIINLNVSKKNIYTMVNVLKKFL